MRLLLLCLGFSFSAHSLLGQNTIGLPLIKNYAKSEYGAGSQTWDIDQDEMGRMYFANNEGLLAFDGTHWKLFPLPNRTIVRAVKVDISGRIFVGGQGEAGFFESGKGGNLTYRSIVDQIPPGNRAFADLWDIELLGESVFFRASDMLFRYTNGSVEVIKAPAEWIYLEKVQNRLFVQDKQNGLFEWSGQSFSPVENGSALGGDAIHGAVPFSKDSLLFVTFRNANFLLAGGNFYKSNQLTPKINSEVDHVSPINDQEFVIGTTGEGCIILDKKGQVVQRISALEGLQDNSILTVYIDRSGNVWTGLNNGISLIAYNSPIKFLKPNPANELTSYGVRIFGNTLYLATNDGAYKASLAGSPTDLSFTKGNFSRVPNSGGLAYRLDEVNRQLMLAHNEGTFQIKNDIAEKLSSDASWLFLPTSRVVPVSRVLVGNYTGLKWLNYKEGRFTATQNLAGLRESFRFLALDTDQQVWASHPYRGIYQVAFSADSLSYSTRLFTDKEGLPSTLDNHVFNVKNRVVFATSRGIYEYDKANSRFVPSKILEPVFGTIPVRYLKEDELGNLWFVTEKRLGYVAFHPEKAPGHTITFFPEVSGSILSGFENVYPYDRHNVFIASEKGAILINLEKYLQESSDHQVLFSTVHAIGTFDSLVFNGFSKDGTEEKEKLQLPYSLNSLHFEFSAPAYGFREHMEYSWKLDGYDKDWSKWSYKTEKDFTYLPNGNYIFKVKGRNNLGVETDIASFYFFIAPPWYKSNLAFLFYFLLLCLAAYLLNYYHHKKLERQKRKYEEKQQQLRILHQLEIEKSEKEIIRLQNEKLANEVSFKNRELADTSMHLVERNDALMKVKETLKRLYKYDSSNSDLKKAIQLMNDIERNDTEWDRFAASFDEINNNILKKLKEDYPALTNNDLKLCAYLQLNMSSKEIAQLLNISIRGVEIHRYRLRKKMGIPTEMSINDFLNQVAVGKRQ